MPPSCLTCGSKAVLSKEAANTAVLLIGTIDCFLLDVRQAHFLSSEVESEIKQESLLVQLLDLLGESVSSSSSGYIAVTTFAKDVQQYQFGHYDYLCLRCNARFDQNTDT